MRVCIKCRGRAWCLNSLGKNERLTSCCHPSCPQMYTWYSFTKYSPNTGRRVGQPNRTAVVSSSFFSPVLLSLLFLRALLEKTLRRSTRQVRPDTLFEVSLCPIRGVCRAWKINSCDGNKSVRFSSHLDQSVLWGHAGAWEGVKRQPPPPTESV